MTKTEESIPASATISGHAIYMQSSTATSKLSTLFAIEQDPLPVVVVSQKGGRALGWLVLVHILLNADIARGVDACGQVASALCDR